VHLARSEGQSDRIAKGVYDSMNFCCQAPSGSPDGLVASLFFRAPALC
jgi:hypothetical protein